MNADNYEPVNVLNVCKGFNRDGLQHRFTPYRIQREDGQTWKVKEVRHVHQERKGGRRQFHYHVLTRDGLFCRLLLDMHTLTWRLVEVKKN
ncbi:MAG: hypothetical protein JJU37_15765 [Balneolaceae bacterium]|nr:hypothetical protein [Balneolaceae bacterium]MCC5943001.1 hypothetical protein [Balneolaceae bacterium]